MLVAAEGMVQKGFSEPFPRGGSSDSTHIRGSLRSTLQEPLGRNPLPAVNHITSIGGGEGVQSAGPKIFQLIELTTTGKIIPIGLWLGMASQKTKSHRGLSNFSRS